MRKKIGSGITDSNGVASCNYTGKAVGKMNVVAETKTDDRILQSETYSITDAKAIFNGTSYVTSAGRITANSDGSYTIDTNGTNYMLFVYSSSSSTSSAFYADIGGAFEFDVVEYSGAVTLRSNINGGSNRDVNNVWEANTHYKIEIIDNGVRINGVTKTFEDTGARSFIFRIENGASITIKNLLYY